MGLYTDLVCEARELNPNIEGVSGEKEDYCDQREPRVPARPRRDRRGTSITQARFTAPARNIAAFFEKGQGRAAKIGWKLYALKTTIKELALI